MRTVRRFLLPVLLLTSAPAMAADPAHPAVVELFTSQGCSSCPPTNAAVAELADRPDVLALSFGVTYWDYLGWKDTFAAPAYTQRQRDYARWLGNRQVFTPQVVVNGRASTVGASRGLIERELRRADRGAGGPALRLEPGRVSVGGAKGAQGADVWLVRYDPRVVRVPVRRGENGGRTLPHRNVVRQLVRLGGWSGEPRAYVLPAAAPGLRTAVLVQDRRSGAVLAAAKA